MNKQQILNQLDASKLLSAMGYTDVDASRETYMGYCLFHPDCATKSFSCNLERKMFHCFGCGIAGNAIELYALWKKIPQQQAFAELSTLQSLQRLPGSPDPILERKKATRIVPQWRKRDILKSFANSLPFVTETPYKDYLIRKRGIPESTLNAYGVRGIVPGYKWDSPFDESELLDVGILDLYSNGTVLRFRNQPIIFPYHDGDDVVYIQGRALEASGPSTLKYNGTNKPIPCAFNHQVLRYEPEEVYIAEGVMDTLSMIVMGYRSTIGVVGVNGFKMEWINDMVCRKVCIAFDNDPVSHSGDKGYERLFNELTMKGFQVRRFDLPKNYKDVNEMLVSQISCV